MAPTGGAGRGRIVPATSFDVAASNSVLNAWVGGRQPEWLIKAKPVKPTPRPPQPPPESPVSAPPEPTPSALAIPATEQAHHPLPPRPPQPRLPPPPFPSSTIPDPQPPAQPEVQQSPAELSAVQTLPVPTIDDVLPSPAPTDEPSPCLSVPHDIPKVPHPTIDAHFVLDSHVSADQSRPSPTRALASLVDGMAAVRQGNTQGQSSLIVQPSPNSMALNTPPTPTEGGRNSNGSTVHQQAPSVLAKRPYSGNPPSDFLNSLQAMHNLNVRLRNLGGESGLEPMVEMPRFVLLRTACQDGDVSFVALHQLFCAWTVNPAIVHQLCDDNVHDHALVDHAFGTMGTILKSNSKLPPASLRWFASFPVPVPEFHHKPFYRQTIIQVLNFLVHLSNHWQLTNHSHRVQGYPVTMSELLGIFQLYSPLLQTILFRASRRTLGIQDHPVGLELDKIFKADQNYYQSADGTFSVQPTAEANQHNHKIVQAYRSLISQSQGSPIVPSNNGQSLPSSLATSSAGFPAPVAGSNPAQTTLTQGFRPAPASKPRNIAARRTGSASFVPDQVTQLVSPTCSPATTMPPMLPSQCMPSNSPLTPMPSSPSPKLNQQAPFEAPGFRTQPPFQQQGQYRPEPSVQGLSPHEQQRYYQIQALVQQQQMNQQPSNQQQPNQQHLNQQQLHRMRLMQQYQHQQVRQQLPPQNQAPPSMQQQHQHSPYYPSNGVNSNTSINPQFPAPPQAGSTSNVQNGQARHPSAYIISPNSYQVLTPLDLQRSTQSPVMINSAQPNTPFGLTLLKMPRQAVGPDEPLFPLNSRISVQDYPHSPYEKRAILNSLHHAHLRSPKRVLKELPGKGAHERYYQFVNGFVCSPIPIGPRNALYELDVNISDALYDRLCFDEVAQGEQYRINRFSNGSLRVRARCCYLPANTNTVEEKAWVTADTAWPEHVFMHVNDHPIGIKRKQHHSKDLPTELSPFLSKGANKVIIGVPPPNRRQHQSPYFAIEIVEVLSHSTVLEMVLANGPKSAEDTRQLIRTRLTDNSDNGGELEIPVDGISIDLADPFTTTLFKVPVRGKACTHLECFDLENWLNTRLGKTAPCTCHRGSDCICPKEPSFVDKWKCPFCNGDARPYSLVIDGFLVEIRRDLEQKDQLRTKSITVYADGTWKANEPIDDDDSDAASDDDNTPATSKSRSKPPVEVIELDDN